jgi:tetratricopeptide (TPR) repeat protein
VTTHTPSTTANRLSRWSGELGDQNQEAHTWDSLGYAHAHLGDRAKAADCYQRAIALHRLLGGRYNEAFSLTHLGDTHNAAGNTEAARDAWQQALDILTDLGHPDADALRSKLDPRC